MDEKYAHAAQCEKSKANYLNKRIDAVRMTKNICRHCSRPMVK